MTRQVLIRWLFNITSCTAMCIAITPVVVWALKVAVALALGVKS